MNAPNRSAEVQAICAQHPEAFGPPLDTNDARRLNLLMSTIIPALNQVDNKNWGILRKNDQRGKVPCDVIVWRDTEEHFDVMTGTGATWIPNGRVTNPAWLWEAVIFPPPSDPPTPTMPAPTMPAPAPDLAALVAHLEQRIEFLEAELRPLTVAWPDLVNDVAKMEHRRYRGNWGPFVIISTPE